MKTLRARFLAEFTLSTQSEIPSRRSGQALRGVYPERQSEILRSAQNDKRRAPSKIVVVITDPFRVKSVPVQGLAVSVR
ncbi:MAG: hypothetical protein ABSF46_31225, partial [Terriglobia bacterium]